MLGMLIRGGGGLAAVTAGVVAGGAEPKLVVLLALPLYAALLAGRDPYCSEACSLLGSADPLGRYLLETGD